MIKSIVHIADIHFRTFKRHHEYRAVAENFFKQMKAQKPDRIVIPGDLVHSRNQLTPELVDEVSWFLRGCSEVTEKVILTPGNHDIVEQNKERTDAIAPILRALKLDNIIYSVKSEMIEDGNVVWCVFNIYDNNVMPTNLPLKPFGTDKTYIGLYHGIVQGMSNNLGFEFKHGNETSLFDFCDITLCGDIHMRQVQTTKTGKPVIMVGSFIQQDHAETISKHGFCSVELGDKINYKFTDIENPMKFYQFVIKDIEDIYEGREVLVNA